MGLPIFCLSSEKEASIALFRPLQGCEGSPQSWKTEVDFFPNQGNEANVSPQGKN